jgi:cobalt/nickel transport protein
MKSKWTMMILILLAVILLAILPLILLPDAEFGGADGEAQAMILEIAPDYEPWFEPIFEPASGEVESLLFGLQAAVGAGIIGYGFGVFVTRRKFSTVKA